MRHISIHFTYLLVGAILSASAWAISDDANPWLAIENAVCVSHLGVDYSARAGINVTIEQAEWMGAAGDLPTHCFLSGQAAGEPFDIRLPTNWNGQIYDPGKEIQGAESQAKGRQASITALSEGYAAFLSGYSAVTGRLLQAAVAHQYAKLGSSN